MKRTFSTLFLLLVFLLMFLPFVTTFNEVLTRILLKFQWYRAIESMIVPLEVKSVVAVLKFFRIEAVGSATSISILKEGAWQRMWISWNCVGWQSALLIVLTLFTGLQGDYRKLSKVEAITIGILGTMLVNIIRLSAVVLIFYFVGYLPALFFHDYLANIAIIIWLFFFWWFVYKFVLEDGQPVVEEKAMKV